MILTLEQMVPSRELCEKLREAGFPQETVWAWCEFCEFVRGTRIEGHGVCHMNGGTDEICAAPTVGEMRHWLRNQRVVEDALPRLGLDAQWWGCGRCYGDEISEADAHALTCLALMEP